MTPDFTHEIEFNEEISDPDLPIVTIVSFVLEELSIVENSLVIYSMESAAFDRNDISNLIAEDETGFRYCANEQFKVRLRPDTLNPVYNECEVKSNFPLCPNLENCQACLEGVCLQCEKHHILSEDKLTCTKCEKYSHFVFNNECVEFQEHSHITIEASLLNDSIVKDVSGDIIGDLLKNLKESPFEP
jgi:hypothetical protein